LPTVTYIGATVYRKRPDNKDSWIRKEPVEVSQEWLDKYRIPICSNPTAFLVEGDEGVTEDLGEDGLPDAGWTKKDISSWLVAKGVEFGGYATKAKLLGLVESTLNPPAPEPVVEEPVVEEVPVETTTTTGDE
jgi:hypothetical protein